MKIASLSCLFFSFFIVISCQPNPQPKTITVDTSKEPSKQITTVVTKGYATMRIKGMTCAIGCAATIEKKLNQTTGVVSATVDFESDTAQVVYDAEHLTLQRLSEVVKSVGEAYSVASIENTTSPKND